MIIGIIHVANLSRWGIAPFEKMANNKEHQLTIYCSKKPRYSIKEIQLEKKQLYRFGILTEWAGYPAILFDYIFNINNYLFGLGKSIKDQDIIEVPDTTYPFSYQAVQNHTKVICYSWENIPFFREWGITKMYKNAVRTKAAHFIAATERAKMVLILEGVPEEKISVMPAGLDTDVLIPKPKEKQLLDKYNLTEDNINIIFAGRVVYDKGIEDLVYAFKLLSDKHPQVRLIIDGKGKWTKRIIRQLKMLGVYDKTRFIDFVPYEQRQRSYNMADILCNPSRITKHWQEQFGFVFAESMACGKAIVSTHSGSIPEVLGGTGLLVSPGNCIELYDALDKLVSNPVLRKELGEKAREYAVTHYDAKFIATKRLEIYAKVLSQK
jgi:glycosyltransferase involved in cell wall biosynthesis